MNPSPETPTQVTLSLDVIADTYRKLRDRKAAIKAEFDAKLKPITSAMESLELVCLDHLNKAGIESARTAAGTVFKSTTRSYKIADPAALRAFIEANGLGDLYENRISKTVLEDYLARGGQLPPGIEVSSFTQINIRK